MTTDQVLQKIRRELEEVDQSTSLITDEELLWAVSDARDYLELAKVPDFNALAVEPDIEADDYGITPEPTLQNGTILALKAAAALLERTYWGKVNRGELGSSWASGLESESTLQAARSYESAFDGLDAQAEALIMIKRMPTLGERPQ